MSVLEVIIVWSLFVLGYSIYMVFIINGDEYSNGCLSLSNVFSKCLGFILVKILGCLFLVRLMNILYMSL